MAKKNRFLCELYCNDTQTRQSAVSTFDQWAQCPVHQRALQHHSVCAI